MRLPLTGRMRPGRRKAGKAVYLQLVDQVKAAAASGAMQAGESLPGIRPLAEELRKEVRRRLVAETIVDAVVQAHHLQIDRAEFLRLAEERFDAFAHRRSRATSS